MSKLLLAGASALFLLGWIVLKTRRENRLVTPSHHPIWLQWLLNESKFLDWIRRNVNDYPWCCHTASPLLGGYLKNHFGLQCQLMIGEYEYGYYHVWLKVTDGFYTYYLDPTIQQFGGDHRINVLVNLEGTPYQIISTVEIPTVLDELYYSGMPLLDYLKASKDRNIHNSRYDSMC